MIKIAEKYIQTFFFSLTLINYSFPLGNYEFQGFDQFKARFDLSTIFVNLIFRSIHNFAHSTLWFQILYTTDYYFSDY